MLKSINSFTVLICLPVISQKAFLALYNMDSVAGTCLNYSYLAEYE